MAAGEAGLGAAFERRIRAHLNLLGLANAAGFRVFGRRTVSGLYHQLDEQTACCDALVIGEWKSYRGIIPKNELLRFKAATDDYWLASASRIQSTPVVRVFGGTGAVTDAMKVYAAQWGIVLVTPDDWPIPALCDRELLWAAGDLSGPGHVDQRTLGTLVRPLNSVLLPQPGRGWRIPPLPHAADILARLAVSRHWSGRAWEWWDETGRGRFEWLLEDRLRPFRAAS
jgi:hypothetical protein